jgi:hypothetical protein
MTGPPARAENPLDGQERPSAARPGGQALLTMLTTEHFTLQGARASTVSESTARASLYVGALSVSLVALGFLGQATHLGRSFGVFVLIVLPTLYVVGVFTFVRLAESSVEDIGYGRAINRIRGYYRALAGEHARYFALGDDDDAGVLANMGITRPSRWQLFFTLAAMVAVLNGVVGGSAIAFATDALGLPLGAAAGVGAATGITSLAVSQRWQHRLHDQAGEQADVLFPSGQQQHATVRPADQAQPHRGGKLYAKRSVQWPHCTAPPRAGLPSTGTRWRPGADQSGHH